MRSDEGRWILSPRDLIAELECHHRLNLEWSAATKLLEAPREENSQDMELLIANGRAHEARLVEKYREEGSFLSIGQPSPAIDSLKVAARATADAVASGIEVIHQATLFTGDFLGFADFLILSKDQSGAPMKDEEGRFIYEPVDAKSARVAKRAAVLQVASYAMAMVEIGMALPPRVHLWLAGDQQWSATTLDLIDLAREFQERARKRIENFTEISEPSWAPEREACVRCRWQKHCEQGRVRDRDLSLVYGVKSSTRKKLLAIGIATIDQLAEADEKAYLSLQGSISRTTFFRLRDQAALQLKGEQSDQLLYEVRDPSALSIIPASSEGDIWFDMEGDPYSSSGDGLEYMFGFLTKEEGSLSFTTIDAESKAFEKKALREFISFVLERRKKYPDMHIYHYASYEPATILRLAQKYGIYESEVDGLKRDGVFVDLLSVVRAALRFSSDSLSIKAIEKAFYPGHREDEVTTAMESVFLFNLATLDLIAGNREDFEKKLAEIRKYNEVDCRSLHALDQWLRNRAEENGIELLAKVCSDEILEDPLSEEEVELLAGIKDDREERNEIEEGAALLAAAVGYHKREDKPVWWNIFDKAVKEIDELEGFEDVILPDAVKAGKWSKSSSQRTFHREVTFTSTRHGDLRNIFDLTDRPHLLYQNGTESMISIAQTTRRIKSTKILSLTEDEIVFDETNSQEIDWHEHPMAILPEGPVSAKTISEVIRHELARAALNHRSETGNLFYESAWSDLLLRRPPRLISGALPNSGDPIKDISTALMDCRDSYIAVQGPPGTGKTHVGAHVIIELIVKLGWRIGVVAQSHAVIENLLNSVYRINPQIPIAKTCKGSPKPPYHQEKVADWASQQSAGYVIGGTAWSFARDDFRKLNLDLIVVDEAGQFSLANTIAAISAGKNALLLGDPQQLPQVSQGNHPEPVNESALKHLLGDEKTMPSHMGYFLGKTFRLHPLLAEKVSRLQYEDRLISDQRCQRRSIENLQPGLHIIQLEHSGNTTRSEEEGLEILTLIQEILGQHWIDTDKEGTPVDPRPLTPSDILIVTAYNSQVKYLSNLMKDSGLQDIRVGTFDKFQGQEAPVVFVSMVTSMAEDLPRGIEFLLSPNRINVAISRAQWASYLVRSSALSVMEPSSVEGMVMLGKFITLCRDPRL